MWPKGAIFAATMTVAWVGLVGYLNVTAGGPTDAELTADDRVDRACEAAEADGPLDPGSTRAKVGITAEDRLATILEANQHLTRNDEVISKAAAMDPALLEENPQWWAGNREARQRIAAMCLGR